MVLTGVYRQFKITTDYNMLQCDLGDEGILKAETIKGLEDLIDEYIKKIERRKKAKKPKLRKAVLYGYVTCIKNAEVTSYAGKGWRQEEEYWIVKSDGKREKAISSVLFEYSKENLAKIKKAKALEKELDSIKLSLVDLAEFREEGVEVTGGKTCEPEHT